MNVPMPQEWTNSEAVGLSETGVLGLSIFVVGLALLGLCRFPAECLLDGGNSNKNQINLYRSLNQRCGAEKTPRVSIARRLSEVPRPTRGVPRCV